MDIVTLYFHISSIWTGCSSHLLRCVCPHLSYTGCSSHLLGCMSTSLIDRVQFTFVTLYVHISHRQGAVHICGALCPHLFWTGWSSHFWTYHLELRVKFTSLLDRVLFTMLRWMFNIIPDISSIIKMLYYWTNTIRRTYSYVSSPDLHVLHGANAGYKSQDLLQ